MNRKGVEAAYGAASGRELFLEMDTAESVPEQLLAITQEEEDDEEPVDNSQD